MKKFFTKVWKIIKYRWEEMDRAIYVRRMRKETASLKKNRKTDYKRWQKNEQLLQDWDERTGILAGLIEPGSKIIEFGAGEMSLRGMLPQTCTYTPSDISARTPDFLLCDLNEMIPFDLSNFDTAVFSGVFEYVYDIEKVFEQMAKAIDNIILSYACVDISNADRLNSGWLSDYKKNELEHIFEKYQYEVIHYEEWRKQSLYKLKKF